MRGFRTGKAFVISGECKLEEVSGRKPEERVAVDPVGIGVSPGNRLHLRQTMAILGETRRATQHRNCGGSGLTIVRGGKCK